ncbi:tetratricopeptide repeat protein [Chitinimonas arctica]|uniref:Tetratricopeptide repeat protein n=1 Tax=Chitinimonas arctica TaxID=2594795 RepID=A0A516SIF4_9NEIS|nr:tetratricopeptide repeat protein [Chitinimonas arctica]QDQ27939.1 tetratricopeptide repeat protein [Chitinimonas arctica]
MKISLQKIASLFGAIKSNEVPPEADPPATAMESCDATLAAGDIIIQQKDHKGWCAIKILAIDEFEGHSPTAHCLTYEYTAHEPTLATLPSVAIKGWHAPVAANSFAHGWKRIGKQLPSQDEYVGFVEYLKLTDFPRYLEFTKQEATELVSRANTHYRAGCALHDQGKRIEAIQEYEQAIEIFPLFFEAIDNRAFAFMELSLYDRALPCFQQSLRVNPNGVAAFFSQGECLMRLGRLDEAERIFAAGVDRFPDHLENFQRFLGAVQALSKKQ